MPLNNCKLTLDLSFPENCVLVATNVTNQDAIFSITDTKLYVPVVTLSTQDNAKLLEQLKIGFERRIHRNKYQAKVSTERPNQYLDCLTDTSSQGLNRLFVLPFEDKTQMTSYKQYYLPSKEIKKNIMLRLLEETVSMKTWKTFKKFQQVQITVALKEKCWYSADVNKNLI